MTHLSRLAMVVALVAAVSGVLVQAQQRDLSHFASYAMRNDCFQANMEPGAIFTEAHRLTKGFEPQPDVPALWSLTTLGERVMRIESALHSIRTGCIEAKAGQADKQYIDRLLANHEDAIRDVLDDFARDAMFAAVGGQVSQVPAIRRALESLVGGTRLSALMGETEVAEHGRARMMDTLRAFTTAFQQNCYDQSFDPEFALSLQRQNSELGTGLDVTRCAYRRYTMTGTAPQGDTTTFVLRCSLFGDGEWEITKTGTFPGSGTATTAINGRSVEGTWQLDVTGPSTASFSQRGTIELRRDEKRHEDGTLITRELKGVITLEESSWRSVRTRLPDGSWGIATGSASRQPPMEMPLERSEKPCRLW